MSAESHGLGNINPKDQSLTLGTGSTVSLTSFVDQIQCLPAFPKNLNVYQRELVTQQLPLCGTCTQPMEELFDTRDNGWSCSGLSEPGGCLSGCTNDKDVVRKLIQAGRFHPPHQNNENYLGDLYNTAGWHRYRCFNCDFDYCEKCCHRAIQNSQHAVPCQNVWQYQSSPEAPTPSPIKTINIEHVISKQFPLFFTLTNGFNIDLFLNLLLKYVTILSAVPVAEGDPDERKKDFEMFHENVYLFLVLSPEYEHRKILNRFNRQSKALFKPDNRISFDIVAENDYCHISQFLHNTSAVFTVRWSCSKICDRPNETTEQKQRKEKTTPSSVAGIGRMEPTEQKEQKEEQQEQKEQKEEQQEQKEQTTPAIATVAARLASTTRGVKLGVRLLKMPSTQTRTITTLIGKQSLVEWLSPYQGMFALKYMFLWSKHGISKEQKILAQYGRLTSLLDPTSKLRTVKRHFPLTTAFPGSETLFSSAMCQHASCPLVLRLENMQNEYSLHISNSKLLSLPTDVLTVVVSFLNNDVRAMRYTMTSCKRLMLSVRDVVYAHMNIQHFVGVGGTSSESSRGSTDFLSRLAETHLKKKQHALTSQLSKYRAASLHLSRALVTLGIPNRMLWRMNAHKSRGNAEFAQQKYGRALCHYLLVFKSMSKLAIYFDSDFVTEELIKDHGVSFNFNEAVDMDIDLLYSVKKIVNDEDTNCFGIDEVFKEFDERNLGFTSRASSELDYVNITCLTNASLCLLKLAKPNYALQFAKYAIEPPIHVKGWRGQHGRSRSRSGSGSPFNITCKAEIRIGQALAAMRRWSEAKDLYRDCINRYRDDSKTSKKFRKLLGDLKKAEVEWGNHFSNKLKEQDQDIAEKELEEEEEERKKELEEQEKSKDDIF